MEGKYFNVPEDVFLPVKSKGEEEGTIPNIYNKKKIGNWTINIIKHKNFLNNIKSIDKIKDYEILWIVSPWKFGGSVKEYANKKGNVYLTDGLLLKGLLRELKRK